MRFFTVYTIIENIANDLKREIKYGIIKTKKRWEYGI